MKQWVTAVLFTGGLVVLPAVQGAFADPTPPVDPTQEVLGPTIGGAESTVQTVIGGFFDDLNSSGTKTVFGDQADRALVFTCPLGAPCNTDGSTLVPGKIVIEQAGNAPYNEMGIYDLSSGLGSETRIAIFVGSDVAGNTKSFFFDADGTVVIDANNNGVIDGGEDTGITFGSGTSFGLYISSLSAPIGFPHNVFYSEDFRNSDLRRHVLYYHTETGGVSSNGISVPAHSFLFAFEDLPAGLPNSDFDFNDFIYTFALPVELPPPVVPEPASMLLFGLGSIGAVGLKGRRTRKA